MVKKRSSREGNRRKNPELQLCKKVYQHPMQRRGLLGLPSFNLELFKSWFNLKIKGSNLWLVNSSKSFPGYCNYKIGCDLFLIKIAYHHSSVGAHISSASVQASLKSVFKKPPPDALIPWEIIGKRMTCICQLVVSFDLVWTQPKYPANYLFAILKNYHQVPPENCRETWKKISLAVGWVGTYLPLSWINQCVLSLYHFARNVYFLKNSTQSPSSSHS